MTNYFWVHGTGTWDNSNAVNWALSSGGIGGNGPPTSADNVFFDANSPLAGVCVVTLASTAAAHNVDFTGYIKTFTHPASTIWTISGSLTLVSGMTYTKSSTTTSSITYNSTSTGNTITTGTQVMGNTTFDGVGGGWTLSDNYTNTTTAVMTLTNGSLSFGSVTVDIGAFSSTSTNTRALDLGSSTVKLHTTSGISVWGIIAAGTGLTLTAGTSSITVTDTSASNKTFAAGSKAYNAVRINGAAGNGTITFNQAGTFASLTFDPDSSIKFLSAQTTTVLPGGLTATGTSGHTISIVATTPASHADISIATGIVSCNYLSLQDITAKGGAGFFAGANSTNVSGNTGWNFRVPDTFNNIRISAT